MEDDLREETGDKEDSGNDRTLALPRTTTETSEEKSYQKSALTAYFFQRQEKQQKIPATEKSAELFLWSCPIDVAKASR